MKRLNRYSLRLHSWFPKLTRTSMGALLLVAPSLLVSSGSLSAVPWDPAGTQVIQTYGRVPLYFIENQGQVDPRVRFFERSAGHSTFFLDKELILSFPQPGRRSPDALPDSSRLSWESGADPRDRGKASKIVSISLAPVNANGPARIEALEPQEHKANYFLGKDPRQWRTNVPTYKSVVYRDLYPGIDLRFHGSNLALEYDIIVKPGADPSTVKLQYRGIENLEITGEGELALVLPGGGRLINKRPLIFQDIEGERVHIEGRYSLLASSEPSGDALKSFTVGFEVDPYSRNEVLVIDPVLVYSTFLGGGGSETAYGIAVDTQGNAYITGSTSSIDFPQQQPIQNVLDGTGFDIFVTKFNSTGNGLIFSTYLGGNETDIGYGIAVDENGTTYVTGETESPDFPTVNAFAQNIATRGFSDAFVAKIHRSGSQLLYSTYLGGTNDDVGRAIAVNADGQAHVVGETSSQDFPKVANSFQPAYGGGFSDAFLTRLHRNGNSLTYSTPLGGSGADAAYAVGLVGSDVFLAGDTSSNDFPLFMPFQAVYGGGQDAFVTRLDLSSGMAEYSSYLGGSMLDFVRDLKVDAAGNAFVTGKTASTDFPVSNALQGVYGGGDADAFAGKIRPDGTGAVFLTYLGGDGTDAGYGIAMDSLGNAYVVGTTSSSNFPLVKAVQTNRGGQSDAFAVRINALGDTIGYATLLGGGNIDEANKIAVDSAGNAYVTGRTRSFDFPTTPNPFMAFQGGIDVFVTKINPLLADFHATPTTGVYPLSVQFIDDSVGNVSSRQWSFGDGQSSSLQNPSHTYTSPGQYSVSLTVEANGGSDSRTRQNYITVTKPQVTVMVTDSTASEPGTDRGEFTVYRSGPNGSPLTVNYTLAGSATSGVDYQTPAGSVTIPAGSSSAPISIEPIDDQSFEGPETVQLTLSPSSLYDLGSPSSATLTITDNDLPTVTVSATDSTATEAPGNTGQFTVYRTGITTAPLTVYYTTGGTATNGSDYTPLGGVVVIPAGSSSANVLLSPINDTDYEGDEEALLFLLADAAYNIGTPGSAGVTIIDNDLPTVSITAPDAAASEPGTDKGQLVITRTGITTNSLTVNLTISGTATNGTDYTQLPTSVVIPPGEASAAVIVSPVDDTEYEGNESVVVGIVANAAYNVGSPGSATVTIADNDLPSVTIAATDNTAAEAPGNTGQFTVYRTGITTAPLTVYYTIGGTATNGSDYTSLSGSVIIAAGSASVNILISPLNDTEYEGVETVQLTLVNDAAYIVGANNTASVTIVDDDLPVVTIAATIATAHEADSQIGYFTVTRTERTTQPLTVTYSIGGTATNGTDYGTLSGSLTIPAGSSTAFITVSPTDDDAYEGSETVVITILSGLEYKLGTPITATVTIVDNDLPTVTVIATDALASEPGTDTGQFTVSRTGITTSSLVVNLTFGGTATAGTDYNSPPSTVTIAAGSASATVTITPKDDTEYEGDETVQLTLASSTLYNVGSPNSASITIKDNDLPSVSVTATDSRASETDSEPGMFRISRTGVQSAALTVNYSLTGSSVNGVDYSLLPGSVSIPAGSGFVDILIRPVDDLDYEGNETIVLTLSADPSYQLGTPKSGTVIILDDDLPTVTIAATDAEAAEQDSSTGQFTVTRTGITPGPLTVTYTTSGTATGGTDYTALPGSVTLPAGSASATITVTPMDDDLPEGDETVIVTLQGSTSYNVGTPKTATVTIADDTRPILAVTATDAEASESGADPGQFTVTRTGGISESLAVSYTLGGTAANGVDFVSLPGNVLIPAGAGSATIDVVPIDDGDFEGPETVVITFSASSTYKVGPSGSASLSIQDNDRPTVTVLTTDAQANEGGDTGRFTVSRTGITTAALTVSYTAGGTATNGSDYTTLSGTLVVPAGNASVDLLIQPIDDTRMEGLETVEITIVPGDSYNVGTPATASLTLGDNDLPTVNLSVTDNRAVETAQDPGEVRVSRTGDTSFPLTVFYSLSGPAVPGADFMGLPGNLVIPVGAPSASIVITPVDDNESEDRETVTVTLLADQWYLLGTPTSGTVTIIDDDLPTVTLSVADDNASETGPNTGSFLVTRDGPTSNTMVVYYSISGSATNSTDYQKLFGSVSIPRGSATGEIVITPIDDSDYEGDEKVVITLSKKDFYKVGTPSKASLTIKDNDRPTVSIATPDNTALEGSEDVALFTFARTGNPTLPLTVQYSIGGTATNTEDFQTLSGTVTIPADTASIEVPIIAVDDALMEGTETVVLKLLANAAYNLGSPDNGTISIIDDDWPRVTVEATDPMASEPGTDTGRFTITRSLVTAQPLTVNYMVSGNAIPGTTYVKLPGTATIPGGSASVDIIVTAIDNTSVGSDRTVILTITPGESYYIGSPNQATVLVVDDEKNEVLISLVRAASEGGTTGQFRVSRSGNLHSDLTVAYSLGGSADNGTDYQALPGFLVIPVDQSSAIIEVVPVDDDEYEGTETVKVTLLAGAAYTLGASKSVTCNLTDNDLPKVSIVATDPTASEPGTDTGQFTITRSGITTSSLTVNYSVGGSATSGTDFQSLSGSITIPAGSSSSVLTVTPLDDTLHEGDETIEVTIASKSTYRIGTPGNAVVTLRDNELPTVSVEAPDPSASEAGRQPGLFRVSRVGFIGAPLKVKYSTGGTATNGVDYVTLDGNATIAAGASSLDIPVTPIDDADQEATETVVLSLLSDPAYLVGTANSTTVQIDDNDTPKVTLSVIDSKAAEEGQKSALVRILRAGASAASLDVPLTIGGTAVNGLDYLPLATTVTIPPGASSVDLVVTPVDDGDFEGNETVTIALAPGGSYELGEPNQDSVTILDNDLPAVTVTASDRTAAEEGLNNGKFTLSRTGVTTDSLLVRYIMNGTATNGVDYKPRSGSVTFAAGSSTVSIWITPIEDNEYEGNETVVMTLVAGTGYVLGSPGEAMVNLKDNDLPRVSIEVSDDSASEPGANVGRFKVSRTGITTAALKVVYAVGGTATPGVDYTALSGTVSIPKDQSFVTITLKPIDDTLLEGHETVVVQLLPRASYLLTEASTASITIIDDEFPKVTVSATDRTASEPGTNRGTFTFSRTGDTTSQLTVKYSVGGTATNGVDYQKLPGTVKIAAAAAKAEVLVRPIDDNMTEGDETVTVTVLPNSAYDLGSSTTATLTIVDNDITGVWEGDRGFPASPADDEGSAGVHPDGFLTEERRSALEAGEISRFSVPIF